MALNLYQWYKVQFPTFGEYWIMVTVEQMLKYTDDSFIYEMTIDNGANHYKSRLFETHTPCSYALTSDGDYCQTGPDPSAGGANIIPGEFSTLVCSDAIPIHTPDQWLEVMVQPDGSVQYLIVIDFKLDTEFMDACDNEAGVGPDAIVDPPIQHEPGAPLAFYYPDPEPRPTSKKLKGRKVKVIWKMDL
jgi:hypothetical protein